MFQLNAPRLILTLATPTDAHRVLRYYSDNREHLEPLSPPRDIGFYTEDYWRAALARNIDLFERHEALHLALSRSEDPTGPIVGTVNFTQFVGGVMQACCLGYGLDINCQGQGYMTEALRVAIEHVFGTLGIHRIRADYQPTNTRSGRLLRRLGFVVEGYARDFLFIDGQWRDHVLTALINPDPRQRPDN